MSRYSEKQLIAHLLDEDSVEFLIKQGFRTELIPTPELQDVYEFAVDYFLSARIAPTEEVFDSHEVSAGRTIGNMLDDLELEWREGAETSIDWVSNSLKASYVTAQSQKLMREGAQHLAESDDEDRLTTFSDFISQGVQLVSLLQDRRRVVDVREGMRDRLDAYYRRAANEVMPGLTLGMPELDHYTNMVQDGELAMLAAFAKVGKSYAADIIALREWQTGRIPALFTLENSIDMTLDRLACIACGVDSTAWQRGECAEIDVERVKTTIEEMEGAEHPFFVFSPEPGTRTPEAMVRFAQVREADSIIIDQFSHVEYKGKQSHRPTQFAETISSLKDCLNMGYKPLPALLLHQINREGKKAADSRGYHEMTDLAESSAGERWCDFVFSMYQSHDMYAMSHVLFQVLAARRAPVKWWDMSFRPSIGFVKINEEIQPWSE